MARDARVHQFPANLAIRRGDRVAVEIGPGAAIGVRSAAGARTSRWFDPLNVRPRAPNRGEGTGFDREILLRADYVPGARRRLPRQVTGRRAASLPTGRELEGVEVELPSGSVRRLALVLLPDRVVLDLFQGSRRIARLDVPDADPRGELLALRERTIRAAHELRWRNPRTARLVVHHYAVKERRIALLN
jgi:hypothetical protein